MTYYTGGNNYSALDERGYIGRYMAVLYPVVCTRYAAGDTCSVLSALYGSIHVQMADGGILNVGKRCSASTWNRQTCRYGVSPAIKDSAEPMVTCTHRRSDADVAHQPECGSYGNVTVTYFGRQCLPVGRITDLVGIFNGS